MNVAIIEDKEIEREELITVVSKLLTDERIDFDVFGYSMISDFEKEERVCELIILDLRLPDGNGIEFAKTIRNNSPKTGIIIITAYQEYVYEGYEVNAFRFIPKPVNPDKLREGILSFISQRLETQSVLVSYDSKSIVLSVDEIVCIESQGRNSVIYFIDGRALNSKKSISEWENEIRNKQFTRVHRRYIVNMNHIRSIEGNKINFVNDFRAEVSRRNRSEFDRRLIDFMKDH